MSRHRAIPGMRIRGRARHQAARASRPQRDFVTALWDPTRGAPSGFPPPRMASPVSSLHGAESAGTACLSLLPPSITSDRWRAARRIAARSSKSSPERIQKIRRRCPAGLPTILQELNDGIRGLRIGYDPVWAETAVDEQTVAVVKAARETLAKSRRDDRRD